MSTARMTDLDLGAIQKLRKVAVLVFLLALIALSLVSQTPGGEAWHERLELVGFGAMALSIIGRAWCSLYIGGRKKAEIVDRGPYSVSRNPLYVFSFIGAFGVGAQTGSITIAVLFVLAAMLVFSLTVRREEAYLGQEFGDAYARYKARTPRFWPRFSLWRDEAELTVRPSLFLLTLRDGLVFLLAIPIFELIELGQADRWLTVLFHLP
jgi:protein-S-isoprenylcysteine O-methyltransferase Ste14